MIVHLNHRAMPFIPESYFAVAVARSGSCNHKGQPEFPAGESHVNKFVLRFESRLDRLFIRAAKGQPTLGVGNVRLRAAHTTGYRQCEETRFADPVILATRD
jgi:hypothetical protein